LRGNQSDARCYLIDAERLLRVRGLAKRELSRRARLLHHVYTWLRIIGESTFTLHSHSSSQLQSRIESSINRNRENSGEVPESEGNGAADKSSQLDDFLRVESHGTDSDSDLESSKDQEVGFRDIHLEDIRQWPKTLYMQIYGIPETWLSLVSQTTRLANVMDSLDRSSKQAPRTFSASLQRKVDRLEHMVCSLSAQHSVTVEPSFPPDSETRLGATTPNQSSASKYMLRALTSALVIFFYRRIRKVHPWILQGHVNDVITALKDFDLALSRSTQQGPGTPWAAFIAGCEAVSPVSRNWLLEWMEKGSKQSAFHGFTASQHIMREVWERRDAADKTTENHSGSVGNHRYSSHKKSEICTWVDVLRSSNTWLMLY
jgi:arginine metabolism regulation protein II